jgi:hypothetical protein
MVHDSLFRDLQVSGLKKNIHQGMIIRGEEIEVFYSSDKYLPGFLVM